MANSFRKDPDAVLDYEIDWSAWLGGDTIATSTWVADTGITVASSSHDTTTTRVWLSGGTDRTDYEVTNHVTTTGGRADDRTLTIRVTQGVLTLPVGIQTKTLSIGREFDGNGLNATLHVVVTPDFGGAQRILWTATGETFAAKAFTPPMQTDPDGDPVETFDLPIVDEAGWLDMATGEAITDWNYAVTVTVTFVETVNGVAVKTKMKPYTKFVSPLSSHSSPIDMDKLPYGVPSNPSLAAGPAVHSVAGVDGPVVSASDLAAALGDLVMRFVYYGTDPNVARPIGAAPVFWIGDPSVEPVNQTSADRRIPETA